ncbi:MAG: helix-turn-helix transcriptional regulator, partial [Acidimicrobiales bacterium]|nr:helix-turn-helix transcriptional regulator [Acidimicrobiales bacterium]
MTPPGRWPLVGRAQEIAFLLQALDAHRGAVVSGAAGVGKSTVLAAVADTAASTGWAVLRIQATAGSSLVPLAPFAGLLPVSAGADPLDRVIAVTTAVADLGDRTLLVVDEAHALDEMSVVLLRHIASSTRARILLGVRAGVRLPDGALAVVGDAPRLELQPLAEPELLRLVEQVLGGTLDAASARRLWAATEGNPLFAREVVLDAVERGTVERSGAALRLPAGLQSGQRIADAVASRLGTLDDVTRDAIDLLAIGQPLEIALLERLVPLGVLHDLERRGILSSTRSGQRIELRLAHPLYAEVTIAGMGAVAERVARRRLVDAIEATGSRRHDDPLRLAIWRADLGDLTDAGELLAAAVALDRVYHRAAVIGISGGRPELIPGCLEAALRLAQRALDVTGRMPALDLVARTLARLGQIEEAAKLTADLDRYVVDAEDAALAARLRAQVLCVMGEPDQARDVLLEAESATALGEHATLVRVSRLQIETLSGRYRQAVATGEEVLAGRLTPDEMMAATAAISASLVRIGRSADALALVDPVLAGAVGDEDAHAVLAIGLARMMALAALGRGDEIDASATSVAAIQDDVGDAELAAVAAAVGSAVALDWGRAATAVGLAERAVAGLQGSDVLGIRRVAFAVLATGHALLGREAQATSALADLDAGTGGMCGYDADVGRARAWTLACGGRTGDAVDALVEAAAIVAEHGHDALEAALLHDVVRLGRPELAIARLESLATTVQGPLAELARDHARAAVAGDGHALDDLADRAAA